MNSLVIAGSVFGCVFGAALLGLMTHQYLPEHHLSSESKDAVKVGMALIATMAALVLGLLIASAKSSYDTQSAEVRQMAANIVLLDRVLGYYGDDAKEIRGLLREAVGVLVNQVWRQGASRSAVFENRNTDVVGSVIYRKVQELTPGDAVHRALRREATTILHTLMHARWQLVSEEGSAIPTPFLVVLVFWLAILFASFGLFAPRNATVLAALFVCSVSVSGAMFLILELDRPFGGLMQISNEPFRKVLAP